MLRFLLALCAFLAAFGGTAHAGPPVCEAKSCNFAKAYYIEDGSVLVVPHEHGFFYRHGVETPEGVRFRPGDTFVQYNPDGHVERDYWLTRVNWFNNRAAFHEQIYHYRIVKDSHGKYHRVRGRLVESADFSLTHFRGLVAFDHAFTNLEYKPGTRLWRMEQIPR